MFGIDPPTIFHEYREKIHLIQGMFLKTWEETWADNSREKLITGRLFTECLQIIYNYKRGN